MSYSRDDISYWYKGMWFEGKISGDGKLTYDDGNTFSGKFLDGLLNGHGTWTTANG